MNRFLLSIALLGLAQPAAAQQQQSVPATLSLADALRIAREHNPTYLQALNNRGPAAWANRNAFASLIIPQANAQGTLSYSGTGSQRFLTSNFSQTYATVSSSYFIGLDWQLSGATLSAPGLRKAQLTAADADIDGARATLESGVTQQYLTVLQARDNVGVQQQLLTRNQEFLRLAQARYTVGQATLIDVRQAQVALGQAEVAVLRAQTQQRVEKLRLFEQIGVSAPTTVDSVQLTDTFPVTAPAWKLEDVLTMAEAQNPALQALRARERSASWGVKSASSGWGPSLDLSAGWSGFTQQLAHGNDLNSLVNQSALGAQQQYTACNDNNTIRQNNGLSTLDCSGFVWTTAAEQSLRDQNRIFPFSFIAQPFQARLTVTLPLWSNFAQAQTVSQAKASQQNLEESVRARALGLQTEVSLAYYTLQTAFQSVAIQDTNRILAREQLQLATDRYRVGSGTFFELLDAQVTGLRAETDYISAVYDYHKAVAQLEAAVGRPLR
jgi:outer membrane protein